MHPRLIKIVIPKSTTLERERLHRWLKGQCEEHLMPEPRCPSDAIRVAASYVLRQWQTWKGEDGTVYKAIAASPAGKQRGLVLDVNVQVRTPDKVEYTKNICRLEALDGKEPTRTQETLHWDFTGLYQALNPDTLLPFGQAHLFDKDLRDLCEALLAGDVDKLWPGVWLCLTDAPALKLIAELGTLVSSGSVTLRTLTLDQSQANREMLAEELGREYIVQMEKLSRRLGLAKPNLEGIESDYMKLCARIRAAEQTLGVQVPCLAEQVTFEAALASTSAA